jgi:DNA-binding XRE family transcriptional regulator
VQQPGEIPEPNFEKLRHRLHELRVERSMSFDSLAAASNLNRRNLVAIENGEKRNGRVVRGNLETWWRISCGLGIPFSELVQALDPEVKA